MLTLIWQLLITSAAVLGAALVCLIPALSGYTFQFLGIAVIGFFIVNIYVRHRHIAFRPDSARNNFFSTLEISFISFALMIAIGSTGGFSSWLLPLYLIYFLLLNFVCPLAPTLISFIASLVFFYLTTPLFGTNNYGNLISLLIFAPIAVAVQHIYAKLLLERQNARLEREKVAYYNLYAEKQQAELLSHPAPKSTPSSLEEYVRTELIPTIDDLQKKSRFPENQLILSSSLTKLALQVRQALKNTDTSSKNAT